MANKQIEEFPLVTTADGSDIVHISRGGADRSITISDLIPDAGTTGTVIVNTFKEGVEFTGGVSNSVNISQEVVSKSNIWVFFDGVYQEKETYEISSNIVIFNEVIPVGVSTIEILTPLVLEVGQTTADNVQFSTNGNVEELLGKTLVFASVAAIQAADWLKVGMFCSTLGYSAAGDGGDNTYQIVAAGTGTADGGNFIDLPASGLQAKGLFTKGYRDPRQFGNPDAVISFISGDATPSVGQGKYFLTDGATTITNFDNGRVGQTIHVQATGNITVQNNANISLSDGSDYAMVSGDVLVLTQYTSGVWTEEARGASSGGGQVDSVVGGDNITVDATDPVNPIVKLDSSQTHTTFALDTTDATGIANTITAGSNGVISWDWDGTNTSVSLQHNGSDSLVVDENGATIPTGLELNFGDTDQHVTQSGAGVLRLNALNEVEIRVANTSPVAQFVDGDCQFRGKTSFHSSATFTVPDLVIDAVTESGAYDASVLYQYAGLATTPSGDTSGLIVALRDSAAIGSGVLAETNFFRVSVGTSAASLAGLEVRHQNTANEFELGFFDATPVAQPVVTGDKATDLQGVVTSLLSALSSLGLIDDQTT